MILFVTGNKWNVIKKDFVPGRDKIRLCFVVNLRIFSFLVDPGI